MKDRHLISVDELRAAGALDVPPAWRKSLSVEPDLFSFLKDDEESPRDDPETSSSDDDEADDELPSGE